MKHSNYIQFLLIVLEIILLLIFLSLVRLSNMSIDIFFTNIWDLAWKLFLFVGFIYFLFLLYRITVTERKILTLYTDRDKAIADVSCETVSMRVIDGKTRNVELQFQGKISPLERQRKFDLEKIPFLRK